jgi:hypothetical protein
MQCKLYRIFETLENVPIFSVLGIMSISSGKAVRPIIAIGKMTLPTSIPKINSRGMFAAKGNLNNLNISNIFCSSTDMPIRPVLWTEFFVIKIFLILIYRSKIFFMKCYQNFPKNMILNLSGTMMVPLTRLNVEDEVNELRNNRMKDGAT